MLCDIGHVPIQGDREREPIRRWTLYLGGLAYRALGDYFGSGREHGIRVTISPWRKSSSKAMPSTVAAAGHYASSVLAMQDAVDRGFAEAILLKIRTNDSDADVLHGITRATVIELARDLGYDLEIGVLTVDELFAADEVFFTSTAAEVTPLACIDDHVYATEKPVTTPLRAAYLRAVAGDDERHRDWVTFANEAASVLATVTAPRALGRR